MNKLVEVKRKQSLKSKSSSKPKIIANRKLLKAILKKGTLRKEFFKAFLLPIPEFPSFIQKNPGIKQAVIYPSLQ